MENRRSLTGRTGRKRKAITSIVQAYPGRGWGVIVTDGNGNQLKHRGLHTRQAAILRGAQIIAGLKADQCG